MSSGWSGRRRYAWTLLLTLAGPALLAGCGIGASAAQSPPKVVDITYWSGHASGPGYRAVLAEVAKFNATHPSIHVTFKPEGATTHGLAAFESGTAPNVGMMLSYMAPVLAKAGGLVNLVPYIKGPHGLTTAQIHQLYYPAVWSDMQDGSGGKTQYLMPLEKKSLLVVFYNKSLFQKAGITAVPKTWAQLSVDAQKIRQLGPSYHGIAWTPSLRQLWDLTLGNGGHVFSTATHRRAFALNNSGALAALTLLRSWVKSGTMILTTGFQYQLDFGTGKVGMVIDASGGYPYDKRAVGGKFVMGGFPDPAGLSGHSSQEINGEDVVMFNTGTAVQKAASWTFVKWLSSPSTNVYWNVHTNFLPLGPQETKLMQPFYAQHPAQAASFSPPSGWWFKPRSPNYQAAKTALTSIYYKALTGTLGISAALKEMDKVGTGYLSGKIRG